MTDGRSPSRLCEPQHSRTLAEADSPNSQTCPDCGGEGEYGTHQNMWGQWDTRQCPTCDGEGEVWRSPNGVDHTIVNGRCITCGKAHGS